MQPPLGRRKPAPPPQEVGGGAGGFPAAGEPGVGDGGGLPGDVGGALGVGRWLGWCRTGRGHAWQAVVSADTEAEAWRRLLRYDGGPHCEKLVAPAGAGPNEEKR